MLLNLPNLKTVDVEVGPDSDYQWPDWMWVTRREAKVLDKLVKENPGPFVELGCCDGRTTWFLATHNPTTEIVAVDWDGAPTTMDLAQRPETPGQPLAFLHGRGRFSNVRYLCADSARVPLHQHMPSLIFIDGNHTYTGVQRDTENAMEYKIGYNPQVTLLWHDYHDIGQGPEWAGVGRYLRELGRSLPVRRIKDTNLVLLAP